MAHSLVPHLQLLQLSDSGLPIGGLAHSFGLESMIEERLLTLDVLFPYLENLLQDSLLVEAVYCKAAHGLSECDHRLSSLNSRLSALRLARESREASLSLGKRFIKLVRSFESSPQMDAAAALCDIHFSIAFGYTCRVLGFDCEEAVAVFLHQNVAATLSAAQRLLSLGQMQSSRISWELKPVIAETVAHSVLLDVDTVSAFSHLPELASMRHPCLATRLFIS